LRALILIFIFLSTSIQAQVLTTDTSRPLPIYLRQFNYQNLGPSYALMSGVHSIHGFELQFQIDFTALACEQAKNYEIEFAIILDRRLNGGEKSRTYINRCSALFKKDFQQILGLTGDFKTYLKKIEMDKDQLKKIQRLALKHSDVAQSTREALLGLRDLIRTEGKNFSDTERYQYLFAAREKIAKLPGSYLRTLGQIVLTQKAGNKGASRTLLREFLNMNPFRLVFELSPLIYNEDWTREDQEKLFLELSLFITRSFQYEMPLEVDIYITLINEINDTRLFSSLSSRFSTDWSLVRLREAIASNIIAHSYPSFWYSQLSYRTSTTLVNGYINDFLDAKRAQYTLKESLWIFLDQSPAGDERRQLIVNQAHHLKDKDWYHQFVLLEFLSQPGFRGDLSQLDPTLGRPVFLMKREYYRSLFNEGLALDFSLMNLALLGDLDRDYLWLLAIH
jgi:hypothetical protein